MEEQIDIPKRELVEVRKLKIDKDNPNVMGKDEYKALKEVIKKFGFIVPIITNNELLIADGFHRYKAAKELGIREVPVIRLNIEDIDRRILRQVLNKLRGTHNRDLDALEFKKILKDTDMEELVNLTGITEQNILNTIEANELGTTNDDTEKVSQLGKHVIECPKCHHKFELKDKKDKN